MILQSNATNETISSRDFSCNEKARVSTMAPTLAKLPRDPTRSKPILGSARCLGLPPKRHTILETGFPGLLGPPTARAGHVDLSPWDFILSLIKNIQVWADWGTPIISIVNTHCGPRSLAKNQFS